MITARTNRILLIGAALLAMAGGAWLSRQLTDQPTALATNDFTAVTIFPVTRPLPELPLIDEEGQPFNLADIRGQWSLVFMGFTNCGHVCPMTMTQLRVIHDSLMEPVNVIFISVDPNRDSPAVIKDYVRRFDTGFRGITGSAEALEQLASNLGAPLYVDTSPDNYIVDHTSAVFLLDQSASLAGTITPPFDIDRITTELERIM